MGSRSVAGVVLPTGVSGLDHILAGGLTVGGLTLLCGPSGSGKSMLAHQLCRVCPNQSRYVLAGATPPGAVASRHVEPRPEYVDLCPAVAAGELEQLLSRLDQVYRADGVRLAVIDTLEGLWIGEPYTNVRILSRIAELTWQERVATVALCSSRLVEQSGVLLSSAACCLIELLRGDGSRGRRLQVHKLEGRGYRPGEHPCTLGPLGLSFDGGPQGITETTAISSLGARILNAFRTSRRATPTELAALLGQATEAVESALDQLASQGYLAAEQTPDGQLYFMLPKAS